MISKYKRKSHSHSRALTLSLSRPLRSFKIEVLLSLDFEDFQCSLSPSLRSLYKSKIFQNRSQSHFEVLSQNRFRSVIHQSHFEVLSQNRFRSGRMSEAELGAHTIKSHGASVARNHRHDWLILLLLVVTEIILYMINPFYRFVGEEMMVDLKLPLKPNTVPVWAVPMYSILLPIVIFVFFYIRQNDVYDLHHSILGLLFAVLITGVLTDAIKDAVGRPRPDFFWRCFPDGIPKYDDKWGNVICHGNPSDIKEGYKSFPSGHTSWSFAGLGFLSWYLAGKIQAFDRRGHISKLCIVFFPLLLASLVGVSRVDDYWHHWPDVFAAALIGLVVTTFCYLQFFPLPNDTNGWGPYAYFRALEEVNENPQLGHPLNGAQVLNLNQQQMGRHSDAFIPVSSSSMDIESGKR